MENSEILRKADMVVGDFNTNGGLLNAEQQDKFIRVVQETPTIINDVRTVPMNRSSMEINKIQFANHILRPAVENTALDANARSTTSTSKVTLNTQEAIAEVRIPYGVLEDNIEKGALQDTIMALIAERIAIDIEDIIIRGDTANVGFTGTLAVLKSYDGILKRITSNVVDAGSPTTIVPAIWNDAIKAMPGKYRRNKSSLRLYVPDDIEQDYRLALSQKSTALGDALLAGNQALPVFGVPMKGVGLMPNAVGNSFGILIDPRNIILGIQRNITMEAERLISERQLKFVVTLRMAIQLEEETAAVKIINLR